MNIESDGLTQKDFLMAQQNFREARDHVAGLVQVERNFPEALAVMDTLPALWRERTVMQNFRLMAYLRLGHIDAFTDLLLQRPSISDWPAWAALPAYRSIISAPSPLSFNRATHNFFWAEPRESLRDALQEIPLIPLPAPQVHSIRRVVETATGQSIMHPDEWERRLLLGHSRDYYCRFLKKVEARFNRLQARGVAKVDPQLEKLVAENQILVEETDLKPITDILKSGRSVVLLELHGGHRPALNEAFERLSWPRSYIGDGVGVATRGEDFNVPTKGPRSHFDFAHLCKLMRKTVRVVRVLPDGRRGQSKGQTEIGGVDVTVGLGAAQLAYFGKAAFVFGRSRWTDTGVRAEFVPGPVVEDGDSKDAVDEKLISFYRACTIDLLAGDPVDFGLIGGYWPFFGGLKK